MGTDRVMTVVGTRPEIIRLSRTIPRLDESFEHFLVHTGQNFDHGLSGVFFEELGIRLPDQNLKVDTTSLARTLGGTLVGVERAILDVKPHALAVLGDTNSSICAVIAKRLQVPVYHMEAGNRSFDENVPEEVNRRLVDHVSDFNLVYTEHARRNLIAEGIPSRRICLTGSPMAEVLEHYRSGIQASDVMDRLDLTEGSFVVASIHREENVDDPGRLDRLIEILRAVTRHTQRPVLISTHPRTRQRLEEAQGVPREGLQFHNPFGYLDYVHLQTRAYCVLSDSGSISEESALLGFPAVSLRPAIERPEALEMGTILTTALDSQSVLDALDQTVLQHHQGQVGPIAAEYLIPNFSQRVVNFIRSTVHVHHELSAIRRRGNLWAERSTGSM